MSPLAFGAVVFACVLGGGLLGTFLRVALPEHAGRQPVADVWSAVLIDHHWADPLRDTRPVELAMRTQGRLKLLVTAGGCHSADVRAASRARMSASRSATAARCASVLAVRWARSAADRSASILPVERGKPQLSMNITGLFRS